MQGASFGGLEEGEVHPLLRQDGPVHHSLVGGDIHAENLPLLRVRLLGEEQQPPPAQQAQKRQHGGAKNQEDQGEPSQSP